MMKKIFTGLVIGLLGILGCSQLQDTQQEKIGSIEQEVSASANKVFTISDSNLSSSGWGSNGAAFCDDANRCVTDHIGSMNAGVAILHFEGLPACPSLVTATLNFSTTDWESIIPKAEIRRILRTIAMPTTCPAAQPTNEVGWRFASAGVPWTTLGAKDVGTDISSEFVSVSVGSGANIAHSLDVTAIVAPCVGTGTCNLSMSSVLDAGQSLPSRHFWLLTGTPSLVFTCDSGSTSSTSSSTTSTGVGGAGGTSTTSTTSTGGTTSSTSTGTETCTCTCP